MQENFPVAQQQLLRSSVKKQIQLTKRRQAPILIIEYEKSGATLPDILSATNGYPHCYTLTKYDDNGSDEIIAFLAEFPHFIPTWRICGIHLDCCVWETAFGLKSMFKKTKLEIVKSAVASYSNTNKSKTRLLKALEKKGFNIR